MGTIHTLEQEISEGDNDAPTAALTSAMGPVDVSPAIERVAVCELGEAWLRIVNAGDTLRGSGLHHGIQAELSDLAARIDTVRGLLVAKAWIRIVNAGDTAELSELAPRHV